jgi:hypothetical protein
LSLTNDKSDTRLKAHDVAVKLHRLVRIFDREPKAGIDHVGGRGSRRFRQRIGLKQFDEKTIRILHNDRASFRCRVQRYRSAAKSDHRNSLFFEMGEQRIDISYDNNQPNGTGILQAWLPGLRSIFEIDDLHSRGRSGNSNVTDANLGAGHAEKIQERRICAQSGCGPRRLPSSRYKGQRFFSATIGLKLPSRHHIAGRAVPAAGVCPTWAKPTAASRRNTTESELEKSAA